jgi:hypothetical protein
MKFVSLTFLFLVSVVSADQKFRGSRRRGGEDSGAAATTTTTTTTVQDFLSSKQHRRRAANMDSLSGAVSSSNKEALSLTSQEAGQDDLIGCRCNCLGPETVFLLNRGDSCDAICALVCPEVIAQQQEEEQQQEQETTDAPTEAADDEATASNYGYGNYGTYGNYGAYGNYVSYLTIGLVCGSVPSSPPPPERVVL